MSAIQEYASQLSIPEFRILEGFNWPPELSDDEATAKHLISLLPSPLTSLALSQAANSIIADRKEAGRVYKAWLVKAPAGLKSPSGQLTPENQEAMLAALAGREFTEANLNAAQQDATAARTLRWSNVNTTKQAEIKTSITGLVSHSSQQADGTSDEIIAQWVKTLPASLLNNEGLFDAGNFQRLMEIVERELKGVVSPKTLEVGLILLKNRGQLVTFVEPDDPQTAAAKMTAQQDAAQNAKDNRNKYKIHDEAAQAKLVADGEAAARERVVTLHKASSPKTQRGIESILVQHSKDKIGAPITLAECSALIAVEKMLDNAGSAGATHSHSDQIRSGLEEVILYEMRHAAQSGDAAVRSAQWTQTAYRCTELLERGYSTGPGSGRDKNGHSEVRTNVVGGRSIN